MAEQISSTQSIGYKVAIPTGPRCASFEPATSLALQSIRYRIGQTTTPRDSGPLAVFGELDAARAWAAEMGISTILECEIIPSSERTLWKRNPPVFSRNRYGRGYHAESNGISERYLDECPKGTVLADAVTPIRVVTD